MPVRNAEAVCGDVRTSEDMVVFFHAGVRTVTGRGAGTRTLDPLIKSQLLCQTELRLHSVEWPVSPKRAGTVKRNVPRNSATQAMRSAAAGGISTGTLPFPSDSVTAFVRLPSGYQSLQQVSPP